ncbi:AAA family ATPase [Kitasatospora sp. NPDC059811]|uniref:AAA family ATPase n=1 Tax=Streptomycetaceae TaxID=2062 RepID=UPI0007AEFF18|nr:AAA family ATPase [Streptomyces sp. MJM8645]
MGTSTGTSTSTSTSTGTGTAEAPGGQGAEERPHGVLDLRGVAGAAFTVGYPPDAVVVVSGLPGAGKSTLLRRWSGAGAVPTVDPRAVHEACEAVMPARLPYAVYRPWARLEHVRLLRSSVRRGGPLLVHDCGSRAWMRRWLAREAARQGRQLHLVLLDVGAATALDGQRARGRHASARVFARHRRGLDQLFAAFTRHTRSGAPTPAPEAASVLLLDTASRSRATAVHFGPAR